MTPTIAIDSNIELRAANPNCAAAKNARSCAVAERCGFKLDATLRSRLLINGEYTDENVYSKLEEE